MLTSSRTILNNLNSDMIQLHNVTLICVATENVEEGLAALLMSSSNIEWGHTKLLSHYKPINYPHYEWVEIPKFETIDEWNKFIFYDLYKFIDTEFICLIHPDGYVIHPEQWDPHFLDYDYIGAPFPANTIFDIYGNEVRVGNSISIRSKRLLKLPSKLDLPWVEYNGSFNEDSQICAHYRHYFIEAGMSFAPIEIAVHFSQEIPVPEADGVIPFAFHYWEPAIPIFNPDDIHAEYVNLDSRPDRNEHMKRELARVNIHATRRPAYLPKQVEEFVTSDKLAVMQKRTPGAVGCWYSQVEVMKEALKLDKHAWVMEDDLVYCSDIQDRLKIISEFLSTHEWDIFWLGGTYHNEPTWHKSINGKHTHPDLTMCECSLNRDWEPTDDSRIVKTYGCWSTYSYIVNRKRIALIMEMLDNNVYRSMGIDWAMILFQPQLNTFAFNPGCVRQYNNQSNIGSGITNFDGFSSLGSHWFSDKL